MDLGAMSISLAVRDIAASRDFYAKLGFESLGGSVDDKWLILKNGDHVIGLFQGMFEKNTLTFNPGWAPDASEMDNFTDVRDIQKALREAGVRLDTEADEASSGPAFITLTDPDGNPILIDQHR